MIRRVLPAHAGMILARTHAGLEQQEVLPAHAGMIPSPRRFDVAPRSAPRSRGDDPRP